LTLYYQNHPYNVYEGRALPQAMPETLKDDAMKTIAMGLAVAGVAMLGGCAVYPTPYGPAVEPAPVYVAPSVVVAPRPYYYGGYGGYGGYGYGGYGRHYRHW